MTERGRPIGSGHVTIAWKPLRRRSGVALTLFVMVLSLCSPRSPAAHETIDTERANAILAATDTAAARVKNAAGSPPEAEAMFALGMVQVEATAILNRDLAAHSGRLTFNGESLEKALDQRHLAPRFDDVIGRYRLPTVSLERALRLAPQAPDAPRARFELLKAGFYESFVLDPFQLVGMSFDDLDRQIAEAKALTSALAVPDDAEEAAFIHAIDLARAARLVGEPQAARAYAGKARTALAAFAETYPQSMRAASASVILKGLGGGE
jgi:hypothetical protein